VLGTGDLFFFQIQSIFLIEVLPLLSALAWEGLISSLAKLGLQGWFVCFANVLSSEGIGGLACSVALCFFILFDVRIL